ASMPAPRMAYHSRGSEVRRKPRITPLNSHSAAKCSLRLARGMPAFAARNAMSPASAGLPNDRAVEATFSPCMCRLWQSRHKTRLNGSGFPAPLRQLVPGRLTHSGSEDAADDRKPAKQGTDRQQNRSDHVACGKPILAALVEESTVEGKCRE